MSPLLNGRATPRDACPREDRDTLRAPHPLGRYSEGPRPFLASREPEGAEAPLPVRSPAPSMKKSSLGFRLPACRSAHQIGVPFGFDDLPTLVSRHPFYKAFVPQGFEYLGHSSPGNVHALGHQPVVNDLAL